jgi:CRP-like cAMP-binding protein
MAKEDVGKLRDKASAASAKGKHKKALGFYQVLEKLEPKDGGWSRKVGEMYRHLGKNKEAIEALTRSSERYADQGFLVKAVAVCKVILRIDPTHVVAQERVAALNAERGFVVKTPKVDSAIADLTPVPIPIDAAIAEISLQHNVVGAVERSRAVDEPSIVEIPLAEIEIELDDDADEESVRNALEQTPLFSALSPESLQRLIDQIELVELPAGQALFHQGDVGQTLYVVAEGRVTVGTETPEQKVLGELKDGDFFGEFSLVTEEPRSATIRALVDSELLAIDRKIMCSLIREEPGVLTVLLRFLRERLIDNLVQSSPLFAPYVGAERHALVNRFNFLEVEEGSQLIKEGDVAPALFALMSGSLFVDRRGENSEVERLATLGPGDLCGEMSLLAGTGAVASVSAARKCLVLELPATSFRELIMTHPQVLAFVGDLANAREQKLNGVANGTEQYEELSLDLF